jgi:hypothetical protein
MNVRLTIFSGIITALVGTVLGTAATEIIKMNPRQIKYESQFYRNLYDKYHIFGAGLGFAIGCSQQCVRELKIKRDAKENEPHH